MSDMSYDQEQARNLKARQSSEESTQTTQTHPSVGMLLQMQRTAGNAAVNALLSGRSGGGTSVQRTAATAEGEQDTQIGERIRAASGRGSSIGGDIQRTLESGLGANLSGVRVHNDSESDHLARSVDSVAFTTGSDIFFRSGAYNPGSPEGMHLLAHEATHTVQQSQGPVSGTPAPGGVSISDPGDSFERAAEANASRVMSGVAAQRTASGGGASGAVVQRVPVNDDEDDSLQTMRSSQYAAVQRQAADDEELQTMRSSQFQAVQRAAGPVTAQRIEGGEGATGAALQAMRFAQFQPVQRQAPDEEEALQAMRSTQYASVQREAEGAEEEGEELQAMRSAQFQAVQRQAPEEEEALQAMRSTQYAAVQRHSSDEDDG